MNLRTFILAGAALLAGASTTLAQATRPETKLIETGFAGHALPQQTNALPPAESAKLFRVPEDLEMELVLAEPVVSQPVFLNFDERGRMWVVQYLQYPAPAGLNVVSRDNFWRAVYDKVPEPPPRGAKGRDKITIHEDTDGDGMFDRHKTFVDGLNIATACVRGRGGAWVLNPPYLLFYPDRDNDDVPDGDPVVHLAGFGLEDTHSVVNSLRWGPDGWLYAAQGSTVTANVRVVAPGSADTNKVYYSQGQNIWRYHPARHVYEVFSEGGGNAFGVEIDDKGRIFSGHNGGDTRGFHYMQGAYLRKGFEKHGELANPYAFGYFPQMDGTKGERFTHNFIIYHGGALPERYSGKLFGIEPLQGRVVLSEISPIGSTFATRDLERVVTSGDSWFRPVDIKVGPDGAIYIADWYDRQVTHTRNQEGLIDREHGRIYRLKRKGASPLEKFDLGKLTGPQLVETLRHTNQWFRETAQRLLADRRDANLVAPLQKLMLDGGGQMSLEALWALNGSGGFSEDLALKALNHGNRHVALWGARLAGDDGRVSENVLHRMILAANEQTMSIVPAQLASTAKRLPAAQALPLLEALLFQSRHANDLRIPLLCWWALESKCESDRDAVLALFAESPIWFQPMVEKHILSRLMRRFAAVGTRKDLLACARLLDAAPSPKHTQLLMKGFEEAFEGRALSALPEELIQAMVRRDAGTETLKLRAGDGAALKRALELLRDDSASVKERVDLLGVLAEIHPASAFDELMRLAFGKAPVEVRRAALGALAGYDDQRIPRRVLDGYKSLPKELREAAAGLMAVRPVWSAALVKAVEQGKLPASDIPLDSVRRMKLHKGDELAAAITRLWPRAGASTTAEMKSTMQRVEQALGSGKANPYAGQRQFNTLCASCHTLFARGGKVGPDLTAYQRGDLATMLLHIVNPSAEIREGYENLLVETADGRSLNGFLVERDAKVLVLRGVDGRNTAIESKDIVEQRSAGLSLMPEGLLDGLDDQQLRDLFAYLRSTQPLAN